MQASELNNMQEEPGSWIYNNPRLKFSTDRTGRTLLEMAIAVQNYGETEYTGRKKP